MTVLGGPHIDRDGGVKKKFSKIFFRFPGKSTSEKTIPRKKIRVGGCRGALGASEFEPSAAVGFRSRVYLGYIYYFLFFFFFFFFFFSEYTYNYKISKFEYFSKL